MKQHYKALGGYGTLGLEIVLSIALGFFAGRWLDGKLHTEPYLAVLGFFFGIGAAVKAIARTMKEMQAVAAQEEREEGNPAPLFEPRRKPADEPRDEVVHDDVGEANEDAKEKRERSTHEESAPMASPDDTPRPSSGRRN